MLRNAARGGNPIGADGVARGVRSSIVPRSSYAGVHSGRRPFLELTRDFTPERRGRIEAMKRELLAEMPPHELRRVSGSPGTSLQAIAECPEGEIAIINFSPAGAEDGA